MVDDKISKIEYRFNANEITRDEAIRQIRSLQRSLRRKINKGTIRKRMIMVDSTNYWALFEEKGKGAPLSLAEGILHTEFIKKDPFAPLSSDYGDWRTSVNMPITLPEELWFVTRDKLYTFDLRFISNPIGWGIGLGVTIYSAGRLAYDLFWKEN